MTREVRRKVAGLSTIGIQWGFLGIIEGNIVIYVAVNLAYGER
jgi:hypothetical protein